MTVLRIPSVTAFDRAGAGAAMWNATADAALKDQGVWQKLQGVFSTPVKGVETLINARENFKTFFNHQTQALGQSVSPRHRSDLLAQGEALLQQILTASMNKAIDSAVSRGDGKVGDAVLREAFAKAHERAELALMQLESNAMRARHSEGPVFDLRPQIVVGPDSTLRMIRPAPRIENLVLRGGGAKGIGNAPALMEMEQAGFLSGLKKIVGTSVGALTAVALATGYGGAGILRLADQMDMTALREKPKNFEARYPLVDVSWRVGFHTGRALELIDQISADGVASYLDKNWNTKAFQAKLKALGQAEGEEVVARLSGLRTQDLAVDRTHQMVTFHDLALMHRLDPAKFKHLVLTGWDATHQRTTYFSAETSPNMPVAVAGRISMSLPVLFKSVTYDPGDKQGLRTFTDGGIGSNMPTEVIMKGLKGADLVEAHARTAIMTFDDDGKAYRVMHRPPEERSRALDWVKSWATGNPDYGQSSLNDQAKTRDAGPNAFVVFHGDIGTLDLAASPERVEKAKLLSTLKTLEQIEHRQGQAYAVECRNVEHCFAMLTPAEKKALSQGGPPSPFDYPGHTADPAYRQQRQLYELSRSNTPAAAQRDAGGLMEPKAAIA